MNMKIEDVSNVWDKILKLTKSQEGQISESDYRKLLDSLLISMQELMHSGGAGLYYLDNNNLVCHSYVMNNLNLSYFYKSEDNTVSYNVFPLYIRSKPNVRSLIASAVLEDKVINVNDIYESDDFDFEDWMAIDAKYKYITKSMLAIPLHNHQGQIIGVLLLQNYLNLRGESSIFPNDYLKLATMVSHFVGMTLSNYYLNHDMAKMFESLVKVLADAIDEKSAYTGGHCRRVPILASMLAEAVANIKHGPLKEFRMNDMDRYVLDLAALLHDCGKIVTPVHIMDKATKLETIFDRIDLIDTRFEVLLRDVEIEYLKEYLVNISNSTTGPRKGENLQRYYQDKITEIRKDLRFLHLANHGEEQMDPALKEQVIRIAGKYQWKNPEGEKVPILTAEEVENLTVVHGTLTNEERAVINYHANISVKMLEQIYFPKHLRRIPEIAANHHEHMDGTGYPRGLKKHEMSVLARLMGVVDVFEALTAKDRPYKKGKKLSEAIHLMGKMVETNQIDADLFSIFIEQQVYLKYAYDYLDSTQIDDIDLEQLPGYKKIKRAA